MKDLQTVLDALEQWTDETPRCDLGALDAKIHEAITIVKQMMRAEPVAGILYENRKVSIGAPDSRDEEYGWKPLYAAPQATPVSAEPVAWRVWSPDGTNVYQYTEDGDGEPLFVAPQAVPAVRTPIFTTGHCKEKAKAGGCQLHNLKCSYPACDRVLAEAPKGSV